MNLKEIEDYLKQKTQTAVEKDLSPDLTDLKRLAQESGEELVANKIWELEQIVYIRKSFLKAYNLLKKKEYFDAWCLYEKIEISMSHLRSNITYNISEFNLLFIEEFIKKIQKLFPYNLYESRELIIQKAKCSICDKNMLSPRNSCGHTPGKVYNGNLCCRIITDCKLLSIALVHNPMDKYAVIFPEGKEYNYKMLDMLINNISSPYEKWDLYSFTIKKPEYQNITMKTPCPCGSGKKYKHCCLGTEKEKMVHHHIDFHIKKNLSSDIKIISNYKN